ncbi:hypothetical protein ACSZOA_21320, partial [Aeromonas caviae]
MTGHNTIQLIGGVAHDHLNFWLSFDAMTISSDVAPINKPVASKTKIDFLSFTFTPEPLKRITELAKQGALLKAIPCFDIKSSVLSAAMPAPAVDGLIYRRPVPAVSAPETRAQATEQRLRAVAYPEPLYVQA